MLESKTLLLIYLIQPLKTLLRTSFLPLVLRQVLLVKWPDHCPREPPPRSPLPDTCHFNGPIVRCCRIRRAPFPLRRPNRVYQSPTNRENAGNAKDAGDDLTVSATAPTMAGWAFSRTTRKSGSPARLSGGSTVRAPTTWTMARHDGPNYLGLRCDALPEHQMALITSDCAP